jgi:MFS family permease
VVATLLSALVIPLSGHLSDRLGRRPVYMVGIVGTGVWGFIYFGLLDSRVGVLAFLGIALSLVFHDVQWGPQAALIAERFPTRLRYSGASISWNLASIFAGGPAPLIATALLAAYKTSTAVAIYILLCAVISLVALLLLPERARQDISVEREEALGVA